MFVPSSAPEIRKILQVAQIRGKANADVAVKDFSGPFTVNSYWDGGSKQEYAIVDLVNWQSWSVPESHPFYNRLPNGSTCGKLELRELPPNCCLVEGGTFMGRPASIRIHFRPENLARLLPDSSAPKLSPEAMSALDVIASIKGGYRVDEFHRRSLGKYGPENTFVAKLQTVGYVTINKAGAISVTTTGKNARTR